MKTILITGVSSGLGLATAQECCRRGYRVVGTVRNKTDGERAQSACGPNLIPLQLDISDFEQVAALPMRLGALGIDGNLAGLINNAGIVCAGPVLTQRFDDITHQFQVNVFGLIAVTKALLPLLGAAPNRNSAAAPPGRIINISSVGGRVSTPFIAAYNASKHAVEGFSHALRRELLPFGIDVIIVAPGSIRTRLWSNAAAVERPHEQRDIYTEPLRLFRLLSARIEAGGFSSEDAARRVVKIFEKKRPAARYTLVRGRLLNWTLPSSLPHEWLDVGVGRTLGLYPPNKRR